MLNDLKKEITDCYMYGEIICQQGFGPKTDISMHCLLYTSPSPRDTR